MKKRLFALLLAALLLSSCQRDPQQGEESRSDSPTTGAQSGSDSGIPPEEAVGKVGSIKVTADDQTLTFTGDDIRFELSGSIGFGVRDARNSLLPGRSAQTELSQSEGGYTFRSRWNQNNTDLTTFLEVTESQITVSQKAQVSGGGIAGTTFTLRMDDEYNVIVPYQNGVRLSKEHPTANGTRYEYEYGLQMQMIILEGKKGGVLIYADDAFTQYKAIDVRYGTGSCAVTVESIPQAPFRDYREYETIDWRIIPYEGDWASASAIYRDFAREKLGLTEADAKRPDWVRDIALFVATDMHNREELIALAGKVDPKTVLLHVPDWRKYDYDVNWPDYTPRDDMKEMIDFAHSLGFRVQLHCNMNGCQTELPIYSKMKQYHMKDAFSGNVISENFTDPNGNTFRFAQINPASKEWRAHVIDAIVKAVEETGADSVHLDQSLLSYNDGNGLIDGLTSLQGNVAYQKELAEALPDDVAIGGEGITEFNSVCSTFLQSHVYGIDSTNKTWSASEAEQIVPVTASVLGQTVSYQWPGLPIVAQDQYYLAWYLRGTAIGHLPTLMRESPQSFSQPDALMRAMQKEAMWYAENSPRMVFSGWDEGTMMRWQLKDGSFAQARRDQYGYVLLGNENDPDSVITRVIFGVGSAEVDGSIDGWMVYDEKNFYGLDKDRYYLVTDAERNMKATHIESLPNGVTLLSAEEEAGYLKLEFRASGKASMTFRIVTERPLASAFVRSGNATLEKDGDGWKVTAPLSETVYLTYEGSDSSKLPLSLYSEPRSSYYLHKSGALETTETTATAVGSFAGKLRKKVTVTVPPQTMTGLEYFVILPHEGELVLSFLAGAEGALYQTIPLSVTVNGETVWSGSIKGDATVEATVALDAYRGKAVLIALQADGRGLDTTEHHVVWADPKVSG